MYLIATMTILNGDILKQDIAMHGCSSVHFKRWLNIRLASHARVSRLLNLRLPDASG